MFPVLVDRDDARTVAQLLLDAQPLLGRIDPHVRDLAGYWAEAMTEPLEPLDVGTVAYLLRDMSHEQRLPGSLRDRARYWATYLEGRLVS